MENEYLEIILELAKKSFIKDEVPVGAIVVKNNEVIGKGYNNKEFSHLITGHAEIMAINEACKYTNDWRLDDCDLYVTLKPCMMCAGAIKESRIKNIYYLCNKTNVRYFYDDNLYIKLNNDIKLSEYKNLLKKFFKSKRK